MGIDSSTEIPVIDFSSILPRPNRGSEGWQQLCKKVREACENYGCFMVMYDKISPKLQAQTFSVMKEVFEVPLEMKKKNVNPKPYHGYAGQYSQSPLYESLGIEDASNMDSLTSFVNLMFPHGHHLFSETFRSIIEQLDEVNMMIGMSILDSFKVGEKMESIMSCKTLVRLMRYKAPPNGEYTKGIGAHTDKPLFSLLCSDQVSGLEVETKDGKWIHMSLPPTSFIFIVGDPLMAWSNGRFHAAKHRVMMKGHEDRYSLAAFPVPVEGTIIQPPKELVDEEHPRILKEFDYMDFIKFCYSNEGMAMESSKMVFAFAGI